MRNFVIMVVLLLVCADGYFHGSLTARWRESRELEQARTNLGKVPLKIGDWQGTNLVLDERQREIAGFSEYILRRYENARRGASVTLLLACGLPGPLAVHSPEVCYQGAGYEPLGDAKRYELSDRASQFLALSFTKRDAAAQASLRVVYSWNKLDGWIAPENARMAFAGAPVLFKLYVTQSLSEDLQMPIGKDLCTDFLKELLPELQSKLLRKKS